MPLYNYSIELIRNSILNLSSNAQKKFPADLVTFTVQNLKPFFVLRPKQTADKIYKYLLPKKLPEQTLA